MSPDGRTLATGSADGTIRLYDLRTQEQVGAPLPAVPNRPVVPMFTPDGDYLFAVTNTGAGLPLGRAPVGVGAARVRGRRADAHAGRVERCAARARVRARVHQLTSP